jgi:hypothetical protein
MIKDDVGVKNLTIVRTKTEVADDCALCGFELLKEEITYQFEFERSSQQYIWFLHDTCFFHMVFTIREFFAKNGINVPEEFKSKKKEKVN